MASGGSHPVHFALKVRAQLGSLLIDKGLITEAQLDEALVERRLHGELLGETLVRLGFVFEDELARTLADQAGIPFVNLDANPVDLYAAGTLPRSLGESLLALPVRFTSEGNLVIAVADPTDDTLLPRLQTAISCPIVLMVAAASTIRNTWRTTPALA
jgi:Type II secretion system (T2SS), protein E, N-terminal domain